MVKYMPRTTVSKIHFYINRCFADVNELDQQ